EVDADRGMAHAHLAGPGLAHLDIVELKYFGTTLLVVADCLCHDYSLDWFLGGSEADFMAWSAARCISRPLIESLSMLRFMLSHASTDFSSAMRFSTSCGSKVGTAMPGSGIPSGPNRRRNISNGSCGGVCSAMGPILVYCEEFAYLGFARRGVLVAEVDERGADRHREHQLARKVRAGAVEGAGGAQHEADGAGQLVQEARRDA